MTHITPSQTQEHHPGSGCSPASPGMCHSPTSFQTPSEFSQKVHSGPVMVSLDLCNPAGTQGAFQDTWEGNHEHRLIHYQPVTTSLDSHYPPVLQRDVTKVRPVFPHRISWHSSSKGTLKFFLRAKCGSPHLLRCKFSWGSDTWLSSGTQLMWVKFGG